MRRSQAQGVRAVDRRGAQGLLRRELELGAGERERELHVPARRGAGIEIGGERHGQAGLDELAARGVMAEPQEVVRGGHQRRHRPGLLEPLEVGRIGVIEMIRRDGSYARGHRRAARMRELLGVDLGLQPVLERGAQDGLGLLLGEVPPVAEDVGEARQAFLGHGGQHLLADAADVAVRVVRQLGSDRVGAEEGRNQLERGVRGDAADGAQAFELGVQVQPVAALGLEGRRAALDEPRRPDAQPRDQLVLGRLAHGVHAREDAAALGRDLLIALALRAQLEVLEPRRGEDGVGVAVHEAGEDHAAPHVQDPRLERLRVAADQVVRAGRDDLAVLDEHRAHAAQAGLGHLCAAPRAGGADEGEELSRVDQEVLHGAMIIHSCPFAGERSAA